MGRKWWQIAQSDHTATEKGFEEIKRGCQFVLLGLISLQSAVVGMLE